MKTHKNLYPRVWDFENLLAAAKLAQRGKRREPGVYEFNANIERNLLRLQEELRDRTWTPGRYRDFYVYEPKKRLVSAAPYEDRVVHHALCRVLEPIWEKMFIYDSYACRVGKGTHAAADRYTQFCRKAKYVLKCDISRYFEHVDHGILLGEIGRYVKDDGILWLVETILSSNDSRPAATSGRGIPIGNLTSQFFANVYLNRFDHWVKEELRHRFYIRYVDDFVILADDKPSLHESFRLIEAKLAELGLSIHPDKRWVFPITEGCDFMGYRIWPDHRRLRPKTGYHSRRKLARLTRRYADGEVALDRVRASVASWIGHVKHADTWGLRRAVLGGLTFKMASILKTRHAELVSASREEVLNQVQDDCGAKRHAELDSASRGILNQVQDDEVLEGGVVECGAGRNGAIGSCAAVAGTTTTTTAAALTATTTTRTTGTTTTASGLPASLPMPGFASSERDTRRVLGVTKGPFPCRRLAASSC